MSGTLLSSAWRAALVVALGVVGVVLVVRAERTSEARGNRLHRDGQLEQAADIYAQRVLDDPTEARLRYNLGTTRLRLGDFDAFGDLVVAGASDDRRLRVRASYNMGLSSLIQALLSVTTDSILYHSTNAIEENKEVLRLDPGHPDAPWNLALAQVLFVNASPEMDLGNIDQPNDAPPLGEIQIIEGPSPFGQDEGFGDTPSEAEEETLADSDLAPLSLAQASEILGTGHLEPSTMLGKLMLREARERRRRGSFVGGLPW